MSALDQAFIKAYTKEQPSPAQASAAVASPPPRFSRTPTAPTGNHAVEQLYRDGSLYRIETPRASAQATTPVPVPHLPLLPPTSPRRGVRRSMLRLLAANTAISKTPAADEPLRVARKVIIRHVSHAAAPSPLGLRRPKLDVPRANENEDSVASDPPHAAVTAELPPETIVDKPAPSLPIPGSSEPQIAPLNTGLETVSLVAVRGHWDMSLTLPASVVFAETADARLALPATLVNVQLESLEAVSAEVKHSPQASVAEVTRFTGKSLDERETTNVKFRVDPPRAHAIHRPHARFGSAAKTQEAETDPPSAADDPATALATEAPSPDPAAELTFVDLPEDLIPSDLVPHAEPLAAEDAARDSDIKAGSAAKPSVPVWEVDRFQWPKACEKLMRDDSGYLAHAGEKLLAAVNDGLRVLAITGTRRGEGRSTLALCLARAAAGAGVQVGLIDADFARPQLSSKLGLEIAYGWQDAALGKIPLSEAAIKSLADNITVLPLETTAVRKSLSLADPRVTATMRAAAATFELLVVDLSPLGPGEQIAFPPGERCPFDAAIVVRDRRFGTAEDSEALCHDLQDAGIEAVGIAENFVIDEEIQAASA